MGHSWDRTGISYQVGTWRHVYRVLMPGASLFVFGGTRTFHRIGVAIEDAGFEARGIIAWIHGNGYPKNVHIRRALDDERPRRKRVDPAAWEGWGTALKPAVEPILRFRKPIVGTITDNIERFKTGALNIDASRIPTDAAIKDHDLGRYPADVILDPASAAMLDEQAGERGGGVGVAWGGSRAHVLHKAGHRSLDKTVGRTIGYDDEGGPSRFFYVAKPTYEERTSGVADEAHPTTKPVELMRYLVRMTTHPDHTCLDPFTGSGTTGVACVLEDRDFLGVELVYGDLARRRIAKAQSDVS
jgi:site-specific DNA-methyltransferase (adenine-specific)